MAEDTVVRESVSRESIGKGEMLERAFHDGTVEIVFRYAQHGGEGGGFESLRRVVETFARKLYENNLSEEEAEKRLDTYRHVLEMLHSTFVNHLKVSHVTDPEHFVQNLGQEGFFGLRRHLLDGENPVNPDDSPGDIGEVAQTVADAVKEGVRQESEEPAGEVSLKDTFEREKASSDRFFDVAGKDTFEREKASSDRFFDVAGEDEEDDSVQQEASVDEQPPETDDQRAPEEENEQDAENQPENEEVVSQEEEPSESEDQIPEERHEEPEPVQQADIPPVAAEQSGEEEPVAPEQRERRTDEIDRKEQLKQVEASLATAEQELSYLERAHGDLQDQYESALSAVQAAKEDLGKKQTALGQEEKRKKDLKRAEQRLADIQREAQRAIEKARQELAQSQQEAEQAGVGPNQRRVFTVLHPLIVTHNEKTTALLGADAKWGQVIADREEEVVRAQAALKKAGESSEAADRLAQVQQSLAEAREQSQKEVADIEKEIADIEEKAEREDVDVHSRQMVEQTAQTLLEPEAIVIKEKAVALHEREDDWKQRQVRAEESIVRIKEAGNKSGGEEEAVAAARHVLEDAEKKASHVNEMLERRAQEKDVAQKEVDELKEKKERIAGYEEKVGTLLDESLATAKDELETVSAVEKMKQAYQSFSELSFYDKNVFGVRDRVDSRQGKTRGILKFLSRQASVRNVVTALLGFGTGAVGSPAFIAWTAGLGAIGGGITAENIAASREQRAAEQKVEDFLETFERQKSVQGGTFDTVLAVRNEYLAFVNRQGGDQKAFLQKPAYQRLEVIYQHLLNQAIDLQIESAKKDLDTVSRSQRITDFVKGIDDRWEAAMRQGKIAKRHTAFLFGAVIGGATGFVLREQVQDLYSAVADYVGSGSAEASVSKEETASSSVDERHPVSEASEAEIPVETHTVQKGDRLFTILNYSPEQQATFIQKWSSLDAKEKAGLLKEFGMQVDVRNLGDAPNYVEIGDKIKVSAVQEFFSGGQGEVAPSEGTLPRLQHEIDQRSFATSSPDGLKVAVPTPPPSFEEIPSQSEQGESVFDQESPVEPQDQIEEVREKQTSAPLIEMEKKTANLEAGAATSAEDLAIKESKPSPIEAPPSLREVTVEGPGPEEEGSSPVSDEAKDLAVSTNSEAFTALLQEISEQGSDDTVINFQKGGASLENVSLADFKPWFSGESGWSDRLSSLTASADVERSTDGSIETVVIDLGDGKAANGISYTRPDASMIERFVQSVSDEKKDIFDLKGDSDVPVKLETAVESVLKIALLDHAGNTTLMDEAVPQLASNLIRDKDGDPLSIINTLQHASGITMSGDGKYLNLVEKTPTEEFRLSSVDISGFPAL